MSFARPPVTDDELDRIEHSIFGLWWERKWKQMLKDMPVPGKLEQPDVFNVKDFGADPTGVTDSAPAIQAAIDAACALGNRLGQKSVFIPRGTYQLRSELTIADMQGFRLTGAGQHITTLVWNGHGLWRTNLQYILGARVSNGFNVYVCAKAGTSGNGPTGTGKGIEDGTCIWDWVRLGVADVLTLRGCQKAHVADFELRGTFAQQQRPRAMLRSTSRLNYSFVSYAHKLRNLDLGSGGGASGLANMCEFGLAFEREQQGEYGALTIAPDYNNSEHRVENLNIGGAAQAGIYIFGTQAKSIKFTSCDINTCWRGVWNPQGAFSWYGGNIAARNGQLNDNTGIAFLVGSPNDGINIEACNSEDTGMFLDTGPTAGGSPWVINIRGCRYAMNQTVPSGMFIRYGFRGPLLVEGNIFDAGYKPGDTFVPIIVVGGTNGHCSAVVRNNAISYFSDNTSATQASIVSVGSIGVMEYDNTYRGNPKQGFICRRHAGVLTLASGATTAAWAYEVPRHNAAAQQILAMISKRTGASAQRVAILGVVQTVTGFTVTVSEALIGSDSIEISWHLAEA